MERSLRVGKPSVLFILAPDNKVKRQISPRLSIKGIDPSANYLVNSLTVSMAIILCKSLQFCHINDNYFKINKIFFVLDFAHTLNIICFDY